MAVIDWIQNSLSKIRVNGAAGINEALVEARQGVHRRLRRFHFLAPSHRSINMNGKVVEMRQQTKTEWDHMQAVRNEKPVIEDAMERTLSRDVVWDIGANVGTWSCALGLTGAEIIAFEPIQANQQALLENVRRNDVDIQMIPRALGDETGDVHMKIDARGATAGAGRASLLETWEGGGKSGIEVPVVRGDERLDITDPTVLKIDVEGAEAQVLQGMQNRLSSVRLAYIELHSEDDQAVYDIISQSDFSVTATPNETGCGILRIERN